jgi:hypothetical protein
VNVAADPEEEAEALVDGEGAVLADGEANDGDAATDAEGAPVEEAGDAVAVALHAVTITTVAIAAHHCFRAIRSLLRVPAPRPVTVGM